MAVIIREARREDVEGVISYMKEMVEEADLYIGFEPGEFNATVEEELKWIEEHAQAENSVVLVAVNMEAEGERRNVEDGEMVGLLNCWGGTRRGSRHETTLGISVKAGWRGQGIGRRMMGQALEWARESGVVRRVQLEVLHENVRARKLYEELGFVEEGVRRQAWWKWGRWMDSVVMGKLF